MTLLANQIHVRTVQCWNAVQAHPELRPFMQDVMWEALKKRAQYLEPLLQTAAKATAEDDEAAAKVDAVFAKTHDMITQLNIGARYQYHKHPEAMVALAPLTVGRNPEEDEVRLAMLVQKLPGLQPAFPWLPNEGLTHAGLVKQLKAHRDAMKAAPSLNPDEKSVQAALTALREGRAESQKLWDNDGGKLDAWIIATVPEGQQFAFGRERRMRARTAAKPPETTTAAPAAK